MGIRCDSITYIKRGIYPSTFNNVLFCGRRLSFIKEIVAADIGLGGGCWEPSPAGRFFYYWGPYFPPIFFHGTLN